LKIIAYLLFCVFFSSSALANASIDLHCVGTLKTIRNVFESNTPSVQAEAYNFVVDKMGNWIISEDKEKIKRINKDKPSWEDWQFERIVSGDKASTTVFIFFDKTNLRITSRLRVTSDDLESIRNFEGSCIPYINPFEKN